jgi:hypothetical protein
VSRLYRRRRWPRHRCFFAEVARSIPEFPYLLRAWAPEGSPPLHRRDDAVFPLWFGRKLEAIPPIADLLEFSKSFDQPCAVVFPRRGFRAMVAYDSSTSLPNRGVVLQARFSKRSISVRSFVEWLREVVEVHPPRAAELPNG